MLSHADVDHYNALPGLLDRFSVGVVYVSPLMFNDPTQSLTLLRSAIQRAGVPMRQISAADRLPGGDGSFVQVHHPARAECEAAPMPTASCWA